MVTCQLVLSITSFNLKMQYISEDFAPTIAPKVDGTATTAAARHLSPSNIQSLARQSVEKLWRDFNVEGVLRISEPVSSQTMIPLSCWSIYRVTFEDGTSGNHLVGMFNGEARVTTAVHTINPLTNQVVTETGRVYVLDKDYGYSMHVDYFFEAWLKMKKCKKVINQTREFLETQRLANIGLRGLGKLCDAHAGMRRPAMA
jgi:hypothetical protein